jgi:predicted nucleic acid-binding protein
VNYLIDTNIISEIRKGSRCDRNVAAWWDSVDDASIYLSVLVLGEIRKGIERARPNNAAKAGALEKWLVTVTQSFAKRILPIDQPIAEEWGRMSAKRSVSTIDALLAATAKVHGLTLATRTISDVADLGADILNPFDWRA